MRWQTAAIVLLARASLLDAARRWGYIDTTGAWVIEPRFTAAYNFGEFGRAPVRLGGRTALIDRTGRIVVDTMFDYVGPYRGGRAAVMLNGKYGFIDRTGKLVIPAEFPEVYDFSHGLAPVAVDASEE
jgi:hypothetical protein